MSFDRELWREKFYGDLPGWYCPACQRGILCCEDGDLNYVESSESRNSRSHPDWDHDWETGLFKGTLTCNSKKCREKSVIIGTYNLSSFEYEDGEELPVHIYAPEAITPSPNLIMLNSRIPDNIQLNIIEASKIFWISPTSCANKVRIIAEKMLTDKGIEERDIKGRRIDLHKRILKFKEKDFENGNALLAVKIFGNAGSHGDDITREELILAISILDDVLRKIYPLVSNSEIVKLLASRGVI